MADAIGILFAVAGGEKGINGESGQLILSQLNKIAADINKQGGIEVNFKANKVDASNLKNIDVGVRLSAKGGTDKLLDKLLAAVGNTSNKGANIKIGVGSNKVKELQTTVKVAQNLRKELDIISDAYIRLGTVWGQNTNRMTGEGQRGYIYNFSKFGTPLYKGDDITSIKDSYTNITTPSRLAAKRDYLLSSTQALYDLYNSNVKDDSLKLGFDLSEYKQLEAEIDSLANSGNEVKDIFDDFANSLANAIKSAVSELPAFKESISNNVTKPIQEAAQAANKGGSKGGGKSGGAASTAFTSPSATRSSLTAMYKLQTQLLNYARTNQGADLLFGVGGETTAAKLGAGITAGANVDANIQNLVAQYELLRNKLKEYYETLEDGTDEYIRFESIVRDTYANAISNQTSNLEKNSSDWNSMLNKANNLINKLKYQSFLNPEIRKLSNNLNEIMKTGDTSRLGDAGKAYGALEQKMTDLGVGGDSFLSSLSRNFISRVQTTLVTAVTSLIQRSLRQVYQNVVEINTSLTTLKIITGASATEMDQYAESAKEAAQAIGASVTSLMNATSTFARLGYSLKDSLEIAKLATQYSNISGVSAEDAATNITAVLKAFDVNANELEGVLDKMVYVGNNYPISQAEIGTGMNNAASALAANNNTLEQSIALLTAANTTVQDISKSSTAVRTIAARISKSTTELEALGEDVNDIMSTGALTEFLSSFGVALTDSRGELRATYDILKDVSAIWDKISSTDRASLATTLAGTRQQNSFYSIMQNFQDAQKIVGELGGVGGTLASATAVYLDSIQGKLNQLTSAFQGLSDTVLDSEMIKGGVDFLIKIVNNLNNIYSATGGIVTKTAAVTVVTSTLFRMLASGVANAVIGFQTLSENINRAGGLLKALTDEKTKTATLSGITSIVGLIVAAVTMVISLVDKAASAWKQQFNELSEAADKAKELSDTYNSEADSLENLIEKLEEAYGDKAKLASIYNEVNEKVGTSIGLLNGEEAAYNATLEKAKELLKTKRDLATQAMDESIANSTAAFNSINVDRNFGDYIAAAVGGTLGLATNPQEFASIFQGYGTSANEKEKQLIKDWLSETDYSTLGGWIAGQIQKDFSRGDVSDFLPGLKSSFGGKDGHDIEWLLSKMDYGLYSELDEKQKRSFLALLNVSEKQFNDFFAARIESANKALQQFWSGYEGASSGIFDQTFYKNMIETLTREGYEPNDIKERLISYYNTLEALEAEITDFYTKKSSGQYTQEEINGFYESLVKSLHTVASEIPEASQFIETYIGNIDMLGKTISRTYKVISATEFFEMFADKIDVLLDAEKDMLSYGFLSQKTVETILKEYKELQRFITQTTNGWTLDEDALDRYVDSIRNRYIKALVDAEGNTKAYTAAHQTLYNLLSVISTLKLSKQIEEETDALKKQKDALEKQKDAYKELIELRKKLIKSFKEEQDYSKELSKKQDTVSRLRAQLALSQLDTSEAGKARTREIQQRLTEAEEELNDFTLEHAVNVITEALDAQYSEYEKVVESELTKIEEAINNVSQTIKDSSKDLNKTIQDWVAEYKSITNNLTYQDEAIRTAFNGFPVDKLKKFTEVVYDDVIRTGKTFGNPTVNINYVQNVDGGSDPLKNATDAYKYFVEKINDGFSRAGESVVHWLTGK